MLYAVVWEVKLDFIFGSPSLIKRKYAKDKLIELTPAKVYINLHIIILCKNLRH